MDAQNTLIPQRSLEFLADITVALQRIVAIEDELKEKYIDWKGFKLGDDFIDLGPLITRRPNK